VMPLSGIQQDGLSLARTLDHDPSFWRFLSLPRQAFTIYPVYLVHLVYLIYSVC
jgi:hypothetical protein